MKLGMVGAGKLGFPMAVAFATDGNEVYIREMNPERRNKTWFKEKEAPYGFSTFQAQVDAADLHYVEEFPKDLDIVFIVVDTPNGVADYTGVEEFTKRRANYYLEPLRCALSGLDNAAPVVVCSTVLPGTLDEIQRVRPWLRIYHTPMFCAMGTVLPDLFYPEFVLIGGRGEDVPKLREFWQGIAYSSIIETSLINAEAIKTLYNCYLSRKVVFGNMVMELAEKVGFNCDAVIATLALAKKRLMSPAYLRGGMGDGGGCHIKENMSLSWLARRVGLSTDLFEENLVNRDHQTSWLADQIGRVKREHSNLPVFLYGTSFKPNTPLEDASSALLLHNILWRRGLQHNLYDPYHPEYGPPYQGPAIFFISCAHDEFKKMLFPDGSIVIDPHGILSMQPSDVKVITLGRR